MNTPLVSVIIPVYRVESYIRQALNSIVGQTYKKLQIILVDDGSPDNSGMICDEYAKEDGRITVIHKKNGGVSSARNAGLNMAKGEWLYFMDPDDWIEAETLETCVRKAIDTGVDMVLFGMDRFQGDKHWMFPHNPTEESLCQRLKDVESFLKYKACGTLCNTLFRASARNNIYFDNTLKIWEDGYFKDMLYFRLHSIFYIPQVFYHYRVTPNSATTKTQFKDLWRGLCLARKKKLALYQENDCPFGFCKITNSFYLMSLISKMTMNMVEDTASDHREKANLITMITKSNDFKEAVQNYDPRISAVSTRAFLKLRKYPVLATYVIYGLKRNRDFLRRKTNILTASTRKNGRSLKLLVTNKK